MPDAFRLGSEIKLTKLILTIKVLKTKEVLYIWFKLPCSNLIAISAWKCLSNSYLIKDSECYVIALLKHVLMIAAVCKKFLLLFRIPYPLYNIFFVIRWTVTFCNTWCAKWKHLLTFSTVATVYNDPYDILLKIWLLHHATILFFVWSKLMSKFQQEIVIYKKLF